MDFSSIEKLLRPNAPDFSDLPWHLPLSDWQGNCSRLEDAPRGLSRHLVLFANYGGDLYCFKEMPGNLAWTEYRLLEQLEELQLPAVAPQGCARLQSTSVLITRYLDQSLPYRTLFQQAGLQLYRQHLLDAIAGLLVQLHLAGVYWGDCSLSNTLFRRDAGALRAYLVDAETCEHHPKDFTPLLRYQDLEIMQENIDGELLDLQSAGELAADDPGVPVAQTGAYIRQRYQRLWEEITREDIINPNERYRIHERIRSLNGLGFSVGGIELAPTASGDQLRLRFAITDRNFHRHQLYNLTGLDVEEMQARKMVNEIQELRATLSRSSNRSTPLSVAAYYWQQEIYSPTVERLQTLVKGSATLAELYCQVLEHKWYLSERARHDVGHQFSVDDYMENYGLTE
jgi:hypothetical protein